MAKRLLMLTPNHPQSSDYRPVMFRVNQPEDQETWEKVKADHPNCQILDTIHNQLTELIRILHPKRRFNDTEMEAAITQHLQGSTLTAYGVWVWYPWNQTFVHILDKEEFLMVRTSRNQYKIKKEEQQILAEKKVGIVGLSVGRSAALTLAMERGVGELRLADFDKLELTNLNRIRVGLTDLGVHKVVSAAREIANIDPFIKVVCFPDGIRPYNIDAFFQEGGALDLIVEECDELDIKILCRKKARSLGIPLLMEASDRGHLDVERYDLEPDRPFIHGLIDHLDISNLKNLTTEQKVPYILAIHPVASLSKRMLASMMEIDQTITTWPQLSSAVALGGALIGDTCRRIFLKQFNSSGRFHVDLEEIISGDQEQITPVTTTIPATPTTSFEQLPALKGPSTNCIDLTAAQVDTLVKGAILAPSGANNQPWIWHYKSSALYLFMDKSRSQEFLNFNYTASYISLGTATENLVLTAHEMGMEVFIDTFPDEKVPDCIAVFQFYNADTGTPMASHDHDGLVTAISKRVCNRNTGTRQTLPAAHIEQLHAAAESIDGFGFTCVDQPDDIADLGEIIAQTDRLLLTHKETHQFFVDEIRWTKEEAAQKADGIDIATLALDNSELSGLQIAKRWDVVQYLSEIEGGANFEKLSRKKVAGAAALGLLTMPSYSPQNYFQGGRALERVWLTATQLGIFIQPMTASIYLFDRLQLGNGIGMSESMQQKLSALHAQFKTLPAYNNNQAIFFLFRLGIADAPEHTALRRPLEDVLTFHK